jgi:ketosteroid isomerase-like protein
MGAGDVEFLRGVYEEWGRGEYGRDFFASEIVMDAHGLVDMDRLVRGREGVVAAQREWLRMWERPFKVEAEEFIDAGDRVVVFIRWHGRGKGSGVDVEAAGAHLWELRDRKAVRWDVFRDRDEALAAAGVPASSGDRRER